MSEGRRVVTANLPEDLVARLDSIADRIERSRSWIVRHALDEWLADEERRYELTLEGMRSLDEGNTLTHEEVVKHFAKQKARRRKAEDKQ
ncbi:ribbon-helix-helix domain-containing protein [Sphingomonas sp.]|uniref:CopG family ribbon-helix-helix protein n=1 Tax=Sphingomonas sp. TaxID=28214 RepID=UPI0025E4CA6D|nr:ribbon-helix-helix domain-containing protein [Sphingomonas sp.]MBV9528326.1 ribbon-helix-helix protein, CopG family [Sphingomonas sp.]